VQRVGLYQAFSLASRSLISSIKTTCQPSSLQVRFISILFRDIKSEGSQYFLCQETISASASSQLADQVQLF